VGQKCSYLFRPTSPLTLAHFSPSYYIYNIYYIKVGTVGTIGTKGWGLGFCVPTYSSEVGT
jgi:hypothetical protein